MAADDDKPVPDHERTQIVPERQAPKKKVQPKTVILADSYANVPAAPRPDPAPEPDFEDASPIPPGTMINNNYRIIELISAGGMGEVFRGENVFTGDAVAIKIVLNSLANDEKVAALFMREAKVLCQLSDQAIVRYYNFVKDANLDRFCLIMEFVDGVALADVMYERGGLSPDQCINLILRLASGLDRAHSMEVIHRDLSPDNVILRGGAIDDAVLIDFGIAKSATHVESTLHGQLAGKFKYISPEQLGAFGGEVGPRTDIYGLGLLIAAAARGEPLDMGNTVVEAVNARQDVPDLAGVHSRLVPIITYMLQPDPAQRPARMSDLITLLDEGAPAPKPRIQPPVRPVIMPVPGLRQPPGRTSPPVTLPGSLDVTAAADSTSPFGTIPQTIAPATIAPTQMPQRRSNRGGLLALVALVALGGFGAFALSQGGFGPPDEASDNPQAPIVAGLDPNTREGFLAARSDERCVYATRIAGGPNSGAVNAMANDVSVFDGLLDAYEVAFDARPSILSQQVSPAQCAALDLAQSLRGMGGRAPILSLDSTEMASGGSIVGRISDRRGRTVWLALVSADGFVYNLSDRLAEQADGSATFSLGLEKEAGTAPTPQMLLAIASSTPLIAAAAASSASGADAQTLLPLIEAEIAGRAASNAGVSIGVFTLSP